MHVAIQEGVAWLEVQVEQKRFNTVEEVHGQAGLMADVELERPGEAVCGHIFSGESLATNSVRMPSGCLHVP